MTFWNNAFPIHAGRPTTLMAIHENLTRIPKQQLREVGWSKAMELVKVARKDGEGSIVQPGCTKLTSCRRRGLSARSSGTLRGRKEPWEILYFKVYKNQLPVIEKALETASLCSGARSLAVISWK